MNASASLTRHEHFPSKAACQQDFDETVPRMVAYVAVFDGHDGANASEYAHRGLLPHILSETEDCHRKNHKKKGGVAMDPLGEAITNAFHKAQERFAMKLDPPTIQDVKEGVKATRYDNKGHIARHMLKTKKKPRGGTTALTLQIVSKAMGRFVMKGECFVSYIAFFLVMHTHISMENVVKVQRMVRFC